jgi:hypothetical protein
MLWIGVARLTSTVKETKIHRQDGYDLYSA